MIGIMSIGKGLICLVTVWTIAKGIDFVLDWAGNSKKKEKGMGVES